MLFGLLLLLPALIMRRDIDALILPLFAVLLMVVLSRYYASTWAMLFALGSASVSVPAARRFVPVPAMIVGGVLLLLNALYYLPGRTTTSYFVINYVMYGSFLGLCVGYLVSDLRALLRRRRDRGEAGMEPGPDRPAGEPSPN